MEYRKRFLICGQSEDPSLRNWAVEVWVRRCKHGWIGTTARLEGLGLKDLVTEEDLYDDNVKPLLFYHETHGIDPRRRGWQWGPHGNIVWLYDTFEDCVAAATGVK